MFVAKNQTNINPLALSQTILSDSKSHNSLWNFSEFSAKIIWYVYFSNQSLHPSRLSKCPGGDFWLLKCFITNRQAILWTLTVRWTKTRRWLLYLDNLVLTGKTISSMKKKSKPTQYRYYENDCILPMTCTIHQCNKDLYCFEWSQTV